MSKDRSTNGVKKRKRDGETVLANGIKRQRSTREPELEDDGTDKNSSKSARRRKRKLERDAQPQDKVSDVNSVVVAAHEEIIAPAAAPDHETAVSRITSKNRHTPQQPEHRAPWTLDIARGGRLATRDPIFLQRDNGKEFIVTAIGRQIRVLDVTTSLVAATLSAPQNEDIISFDAVYTMEEHLVRVLYSSGVLVDWDWISHTSDESRPVADDVDIYRLSVVGERIASVFTTWNGRSCKILLDGREIHKTKQRVLDLRMLHGVDILTAWCGDAILLGRKEITDQYSWVELPWTNSTCFDAREIQTIKQTKDISLVVGQADGALQLYNSVSSVFSSGNLQTPRRLHWHRNAVASVKFSRDGSYLISGGQETVLVLWQLETGKKSYLPNLTATIVRIVVNQSGNKYALQMGDNSIMVISTSEMKPIANFAGLQAADRTLAAVWHPTDKDHMLLSVASDVGGITRPFLQTYDATSDKHISRQALTRNNVTDLSTNPDMIPILPPDVAFLALSPDGQWLATVDIWTPPQRDLAYLATEEYMHNGDKTDRREVYLKIWQWNAATLEWMLNTRIDDPHKDGFRSDNVFKLVSDPTQSGFVTVGEDSMIRVWRPQRKTKHNVVLTGAADIQWHCARTIALEKVEDRSDLELEDNVPSGAALAISDDGSLLAVSMLGDNVVHFVDIVECKVRSSHNNIAGGDLLELAFIDRYLVALSRRALRIWDVVEDRLHLSKQLQDSAEALLAVSRADNAVAVASPASNAAPPVITIWQVQPAELQCRIQTEEPVTAILTRPDTRGFQVTFEDATIRTLSRTAALSSAQILAVTEVAETDPVEQSIATSSLIEADVAIVTPFEKQFEDDRSVVRPEDLSKIFEVGNSVTALPSVREMFHAVAGLFGRRPRL